MSTVDTTDLPDWIYVGGIVAVRSFRHPLDYRQAAVERITNTQIVLGGSLIRFRRSDLQEISVTGYRIPDQIVDPADPEARIGIARSRERRTREVAGYALPHVGPDAASRADLRAKLGAVLAAMDVVDSLTPPGGTP